MGVTTASMPRWSIVACPVAPSSSSRRRRPPPWRSPAPDRCRGQRARMPVVGGLRGACGGDTRLLLQDVEPDDGSAAPRPRLGRVPRDHHGSIGTLQNWLVAGCWRRHSTSTPRVVEGGIPVGDDGVYCTVGIVREVCGGAGATIAVGSCAFDGGASSADEPPGRSGGEQVMRTSRSSTCRGCPVNVENLTATIVHYLTFNTLPRPTHATGRCSRTAVPSTTSAKCRAHFEFGEFVQAVGDEGRRRAGACTRWTAEIRQLPDRSVCGRHQLAGQAGHGCIGCTMARAAAGSTALRAAGLGHESGMALVGGVAALTVVHGRAVRWGAEERRAASGWPRAPPPRTPPPRTPPPRARPRPPKPKPPIRRSPGRAVPQGSADRWLRRGWRPRSLRRPRPRSRRRRPRRRCPRRRRPRPAAWRGAPRRPSDAAGPRSPCRARRSVPRHHRPAPSRPGRPRPAARRAVDPAAARTQGPSGPRTRPSCSRCTRDRP